MTASGARFAPSSLVRMFSRTLRGAAALLCVVAIACSGDDPTPPPPLAPSLAVTLSGIGTSIVAGTGASFTATVTRTNYSSPVTITVSGTPMGVTSSVTSNGDTYSIALATVASTAPGNYPLTVTASGTGVASATASYTLSLSAPPVASYTLAIAPTTLSVQQGSSGQVTVNLTRSNFTGVVNLAVSGVPAGANAILGSTGVTGDNTTLSLAAGGAVTPGTYTVTVTGSAAGIPNRTATLTFVVTAGPPPTASITLSANPSTLNAISGGAAVTTVVTISRTNYPGDVNLVAGPLPNGASVSFAPSTTTGNTSTLSLTFASMVPAGNYPITITGTGGGISAASTQITVAVSPLVQSGIRISASDLTVAQGATGTATVTIARTNFAGAVSLGLSTPPAGVTAAAPPPTTANQTTLSILVGATVAPGAYNITITASGAGISSATAVVTLTVTAAPSGGSVTRTFCGSGAALPIWVASQNGSGPWVQLAPGSGNTYTFDVTTVGALAWVIQTGADDFALTVTYGSAAELNQGSSCATINPTGRTATGTVNGFGAMGTDRVVVNFGGRTPNVEPTTASPAFTINDIPAGPRDLLAARFSTPTLTQANRIVLRRGLDPSNGGSLGAVDFSSTTDAFDPVSRNATPAATVAGEVAAVTVSYFTARGSTTLLSSATAPAGTTFAFSALPPTRTAAGDFHVILATATSVIGTPSTGSRFVQTLVRDPNDLTLTLGALLNVPTISSMNAGYARLRFAMARQAEYSDFWVASAIQSAATSARSVSLGLTPAYLGAANTVTVEVPDFTTVAGWQNLWGPRPGVQATWNVTATGWLVGGGNQTEGALTRGASRTGIFTP